MTTTEAEPISVMFDHCKKAYELMRETAEDNEGVLVWEGYMTHLINDQMGMATPYYSSILKNLKRMGCVKQLRRGGSSTPSQWILLKRPTPDLFKEQGHERGNGRMAALEQQIRDLTRRVGTLEDNFQRGIEVVREDKSA